MKKSRGQAKVTKVMHEFGAGKLHSGSKRGPEVTSRKQAIAIAMSEAGLSRTARSPHPGQSHHGHPAEPYKTPHHLGKR